ncbi:IQ motif, EF-hand binding site [Plasmopara halstedii]|uniref:IQ motif, EF-hand binding site n=1 Tax=Plasmopara halstedii TaxID=4781 RepID=A0A0P1AA82_PLAHL|nr:IQ motif, EF-hand binding site [Plasmopara halstedii]CEG37127.1 IQ motif, EF-hand binding site [Plasmopara halstedii]|eukprot:XP_024573496.1 IQ motif, EF-hand binding site [Plasmopara halstedii]
MRLKKGSLLGSSSSIENIGQTVIEGDRNLLSHICLKSDQHGHTLDIVPRKAAALRRNLVARGSTQQQVEHKHDKGSHKSQAPRYHRKLKIFKIDQHRHGQCAAKENAETIVSERQEGSNNEDEFCSERTSYALTRSVTCTTHTKSPTIPPKVVTRFLRKTSMRQHCENQQENDDLVSSFRQIEKLQTTVLPQTRASGTFLATKENAHLDAQGGPMDPTLTLPLANRSTRLVHRELVITKDILMREQLVRQLKQKAALIDSLANDFVRVQDRLKHAQEKLELTSAVSFSSDLMDTAAETADSKSIIAEAEVNVIRLRNQVATLIKRLNYHVHHMDILITGFRQSTATVIEGILKWRKSSHRRRHVSNSQRLVRFSWRIRKTTNYLLQIDEDVRSLFPSVALELLLGPSAVYNPLMLSCTMLKQLQSPYAGKISLIENNCSSCDPFSPETSNGCLLSAENIADLRKTLISSPITPTFDRDRLQQCLSAINDEKDLEALEKQRLKEEQEQVQSVYDPFTTIKFAGGVEQILSDVIATQLPTSHLLTEQLRTRQEDTNHDKGILLTTASPDEKFLVNCERLRLYITKRSTHFESSSRLGQKNKLQGNVVVRLNNEKRIRNYYARKIQLQYLAHRQRHAIFKNLAQLVRKVQASVIDIQRVFRGYRAKYDFKSMKSLWWEHKHQIAAIRTITNAFRRHQRRLRHGQSMTLESIAHARYVNMMTMKQNELDYQRTEQYRRAGEERRRQRLLQFQKDQMEQRKLTAAIRLQAMVRARLAKNQAQVLRQKRIAQVNAISAITIQARIRKYLKTRKIRRQQCQELARINKSAIRIQSIYRGYSLRLSLLRKFDDKSCHTKALNSEGGRNDSIHDKSKSRVVVAAEKKVMHSKCLPRIRTSLSRPSIDKNNLSGRKLERSRAFRESISLPPLYCRDKSIMLSPTETSRRLSIGMTRIELKLKEAEIRANFDSPPSRRSSFIGSTRHIT